MSSVRISQHGRPGAAPVSGESGRPEGRPGNASFAVALGAAAQVQKGPGQTPSSDKAVDTADSGPGSRKRAGGDGKNADAAAMLVAQGALLATSGDPASLSARDMVVGRADLTNASVSPGDQPTADVLSNLATADEVSANRPLNPLQAMVGVVPGEPAQTAMADGLVTNSPPADADGLASNLGPQMPIAPNSHVSQALPGVMAGLTQGLAPAAAGQPGAGGEDVASGGEGRERFASVVAARGGGHATEAAGLAAAGEPPALANAPTTAAAPATVTDSSGATTISDQVAGHVVRLVASGSREMVMRLHPPELGEVTVRIAISGRDVSAWFGSPQPQVQTAIADGIAQLQTGLGGAGYNLSGAWVGADASGARQQAAGPLPPASLVARAAEQPNPAVSQPLASAVNIYV